MSSTCEWRYKRELETNAFQRQWWWQGIHAIGTVYTQEGKKNKHGKNTNRAAC